MNDHVTTRVHRAVDDSAHARYAKAIIRDMDSHLNGPNSTVSDGEVLSFEAGVKFALERLEFAMLKEGK